MTLTVTLGIPGSGKTTWAQQHANDHDAVLVTTDDVRTRGRHPAQVFAEVEQQAREALRSGRSVVIDACNMTRGQRRRWLRLARTCGATAQLAVIDTDPTVARARNAARPPSQRVPEDRMVEYVEAWPVALATIAGEPWRIVRGEAAEPAQRVVGVTRSW